MGVSENVLVIDGQLFFPPWPCSHAQAVGRMRTSEELRAPRAETAGFRGSPAPQPVLAPLRDRLPLLKPKHPSSAATDTRQGHPRGDTVGPCPVLMGVAFWQDTDPGRTGNHGPQVQFDSPMWPSGAKIISFQVKQVSSELPRCHGVLCPH